MRSSIAAICTRPAMRRPDRRWTLYAQVLVPTLCVALPTRFAGTPNGSLLLGGPFNLANLATSNAMAELAILTPLEATELGSANANNIAQVDTNRVFHRPHRPHTFGGCGHVYAKSCELVA